MSKNKTKWVNGFMDLDPDYQVEIAEAIIDELSLNEETFEDDDEEDYDVDKSKSLRAIFETFISSSKKSSELRHFKEIIGQYDALPDEKKARVVSRAFEEIKSQVQLQAKENNEAVCKKVGHAFRKWEYNSWTTHEDTVIDHQFVHGYPCHHENWTRRCSRCGFEETLEEEPESVRASRVRREKNQKIKSLEAELKRLKGES